MQGRYLHVQPNIHIPGEQRLHRYAERIIHERCGAEHSNQRLPERHPVSMGSDERISDEDDCRADQKELLLRQPNTSSRSR